MFHVMYLRSLCARRNWSEPIFSIRQTSLGYTCVVHVNNRAYMTESPCATPDLAQDSAALEAYVVCRNFSMNNGMPPGQRPGQQGVLQGLPVAIGTGRRSTGSSSSGTRPPSSYSSSTSHSPPSSSGRTAVGSSSRRNYRTSFSGASDSGSDGRRSSSGSNVSARVCPCGYAAYGAFDRCVNCLRRERAYGYYS